MDDESRELLERVRAVIAERDALRASLADALAARDDARRASEQRYALMREAEALLGMPSGAPSDEALAEGVERLRRAMSLPVIATCGACGYESPSVDAAGDECSVCTNSGPAWSRVRADKSPPTWCPLRGAR